MHRLQKKVLTYLARCSISKSLSSILWFLCVDEKRDREKDREREERKERANFMDEICNNFHVFSLRFRLSRFTSFVVVLIKILSSVT